MKSCSTEIYAVSGKTKRIKQNKKTSYIPFNVKDTLYLSLFFIAMRTAFVKCNIQGIVMIILYQVKWFLFTAPKMSQCFITKSVGKLCNETIFLTLSHDVMQKMLRYFFLSRKNLIQAVTN